MATLLAHIINERGNYTLYYEDDEFKVYFNRVNENDKKKRHIATYSTRGWLKEGCCRFDDSTKRLFQEAIEEFRRNNPLRNDH